MALRKGENPYIYGLHDRGGEHLMIVNDQAKGWVLVTEAIGADPNDQSGSNYQELADKGLGVIVRLNNAYGSSGTIPHPSQYDNFARRVANFVRNSPGASIWLIGNEMNLEREQPRKPGSDQAEPITPRHYAECYTKCRAAIKALPGHEHDTVVVGAIGPWNGQTAYEADPMGKYPANKLPGGPPDYPYNGFFGDFITYMRHMLLAIGPENCDAIAIHAYSHGYNPDLVFSESKMGSPFENYCFHFRTYRDQMAAIPENMRHLPVYLTEANGDQEPDGATWPFGNNGWIKNAYKEINEWNQTPGNQQIRCLILFRWIIDPHGWSIDGKTEVQDDFKEAIAQNYQWDQEAADRVERPTVPAIPPITIPTTTGIQIEDISARLPTNDEQPPYPRRDRADIRRFIIHHTATPASVPVERVANFQVSNRGLPAISYHFCLTSQGEVYQTQPLEVASTHAGDHSAESLGICLIGDFTTNPPPEAQLSATAALIAHLASQLNLEAKANTIQGYRELTSTQSPGNTWPNWKEPLTNSVRELLVSGEATTIVTAPPPTPPEPEPTPARPQVPPYRTRFLSHNTPQVATSGQNLTVNLTIQNTGSFTWGKEGPNPFRLGFRWFDGNGQMVQLPSELDFRTPLPIDVQPNMSVTLRAMLRTPDAPGSYRLQWDMVHELITWFSTQGDPGLIVEGITINPVVTAPTPAQPGLMAQISDISASLATNSQARAYQRRSQGAIRRLIIHHSATSPNLTVQRIAEFQTQRQNKPGIVYHFCLTAQGEIFQTQPLEVVATHAGAHSADSLGICLIGNFMDTPPPTPQVDAAATLLAQLASELGLSLNPGTVLGYQELVNTQSPGATWPAWKSNLISQAQAIQAGLPAAPAPAPVPATYPKVIEHYLLLWHQGPDNWAEWDLISAIEYIGQFRPMVGFSVEEAKHAKYVTIVGGPGGVPGDTEKFLRAAGCQVERLGGRTQEETNQMLYDLLAQGRRFRTLR